MKSLFNKSPPARGAWIATTIPRICRPGGRSRLPRGGRGSQHRASRRTAPSHRVASREGGVDRNCFALWPGRPHRVASREGGVDRNIPLLLGQAPRATSPPARGAWIATPMTMDRWTMIPVASREGGVDRNIGRPHSSTAIHVASREGGVDRNQFLAAWYLASECRLPRGGRGSQHVGVDLAGVLDLSPPARGAWIATPLGASGWTLPLSPPARGAWIATRCTRTRQASRRVASREGGVDRNQAGMVDELTRVRRLPRGGRGSQPEGASIRIDRLSRLPRGGRGSQPARRPAHRGSPVSPPARGAWIATWRSR